MNNLISRMGCSWIVRWAAEVVTSGGGGKAPSLGEDWGAPEDLASTTGCVVLIVSTGVGAVLQLFALVLE